MTAKVLVAHGDTQELERVVRVLSSAGLGVVATPDGGDAFARFFEEEPDLVLCSEGLPVLDGRSFGRMIASQSPSTPVVLLVPEEAVAEDSEFLVLSEPFELNAFFEKVPGLRPAEHRDATAETVAGGEIGADGDYPADVLAILIGFRREGSMLAFLDRMGLVRMARLAQLQERPANELVIREGDVCDGFYLVVSGQVKVTLAEHDQQEVARLNDGEFFGEMALLSSQPRAASVWTSEPTRLMFFERQAVLELLGDYPALREMLGGVAVQRTEENLWLALSEDGEVQRNLEELLDRPDTLAETNVSAAPHPGVVADDMATAALQAAGGVKAVELGLDAENDAIDVQVTYSRVDPSSQAPVSSVPERTTPLAVAAVGSGPASRMVGGDRPSAPEKSADNWLLGSSPPTVEGSPVADAASSASWENEWANGGEEVGLLFGGSDATPKEAPSQDWALGGQRAGSEGTDRAANSDSAPVGESAPPPLAGPRLLVDPAQEEMTQGSQEALAGHCVEDDAHSSSAVSVGEAAEVAPDPEDTRRISHASIAYRRGRRRRSWQIRKGQFWIGLGVGVVAAGVLFLGWSQLVGPREPDDPMDSDQPTVDSTPAPPGGVVHGGGSSTSEMAALSDPTAPAGAGAAVSPGELVAADAAEGADEKGSGLAPAESEATDGGSAGNPSTVPSTMTAVEDAASSSAAPSRRGFFGAVRGRRWEEVVAAGRVLRGRPEFDDRMLFALAEAERELEQRDRALRDYRLLPEKFPFSDRVDDSRFWAAKLLAGRGRFTEALELFRLVSDDGGSEYRQRAERRIEELEALIADDRP